MNRWRKALPAQKTRLTPARPALPERRYMISFLHLEDRAGYEVRLLNPEGRVWRHELPYTLTESAARIIVNAFNAALGTKVEYVDQKCLPGSPKKETP